MKKPNSIFFFSFFERYDTINSYTIHFFSNRNHDNDYANDSDNDHDNGHDNDPVDNFDNDYDNCSIKP